MVGIVVASGVFTGGLPRLGELKGLATNGAILAAILALFCAACNRAYAGDTVEEEYAPDINFLKMAKKWAKWVDMDDVLGRGWYENKTEWVTFERQSIQ